MPAGLRRRAERRELSSRIKTRTCGKESLGIGDLSGQIDFVLAFAVVHEVQDTARFFSEVHAVLRQGGKVLFAEPTGHVTKEAFEKSVSIAEASGLWREKPLQIRRSHAIILSVTAEEKWTHLE